MIGAIFFDNFFWFLLGFVVMVLWLVRPRPWARDCRRLAKMAKIFNGHFEHGENRAALHGHWHGVKTSIVLRLASISRAIGAISYEHKTSFKINIYDEASFCELDEQIGGENEVKSSEESFDRKFLIFSNRLDQAKAFIANPAVRGKIREISKYGFSHIKANTKVIILEKAYAIGHMPQRDLVKIVELLRELSGMMV